jgi:lysozyme
MFINYEQATSLLLADVQEAEQCVRREVKVPLQQSMFDSLVSFVFNLGCGAFRTSTLLARLNEGNYLTAADQFPRWVNAGGRQLPGLVRRRALEQGLFLSGLQLVHNFTLEEQHEKGIESYPDYVYATSMGMRTPSSFIQGYTSIP